jgi:hypothetical protein
VSFARPTTAAAALGLSSACPTTAAVTTAALGVAPATPSAAAAAVAALAGLSSV